MAIFMFGINLGHSYTICPAIEIILKDLKLKPVNNNSYIFSILYRCLDNNKSF